MQEVTVKTMQVATQGCEVCKAEVIFSTQLIV